MCIFYDLKIRYRDIIIHMHLVYVIVVLWFSKVYGYTLYPECGIMEFRGLSPRNSIIPRKGYNQHTLENHSTTDLCYDATNQTVESVSLPQAPCFTVQLGCIVIHPRVYALSRVHGVYTGSFSFEVWLQHSTNNIIPTTLVCVLFGPTIPTYTSLNCFFK